MKSNATTRGLAMALLVVYLLWSLFNLPFTNILVSASVGLISYGSSESIEVSTVAAVATGIAFYAYRQSWFDAKEGFVSNDLAVIQPGGPEFETNGSQQKESNKGCSNGQQDLTSIVDRVAALSGRKANPEIKGMLSANYLEGFADADTVENPVPDAGSKAAEKKKEDAAAPPSDAPAPVAEADKVSDEMKKDLPNKEAVENFTRGGAGSGADNTALFRLGSIPTELKGGPHIDAGSTLMSALNALKPDQIKAMTDDTQKLMETQKNLMGMLQSMKPILQDGKAMMETFGTMFNK